VQAFLLKQSRWANQLQNLSWRLDVKSKLSRQDIQPFPVAVVEMSIGKEEDNSSQVVRFEMDQKQLKNTVKEIERIEDLLQQK